MAEPGRVVVLGSLNVDLVARVRALPRAGETVAGGDLVRLPGGKGANQAVAAAAAGARVALVGRVGDDADGVAYVDGLRARGVDVSAVRVTPDVPTGHALIVVDGAGENTIVVAPGANSRVVEQDAEAVLRSGADVLLAQLEVPLAVVAYAAGLAVAQGTRVVLNASPVTEIPAGLLAACDPLVVNELEAVALVGGRPGAGAVDLAQAVLGLGCRAVVLTRGAEGAVYADGERVVHEPGVPAEVVDTTGAGDAFTGTLAASLAGGGTVEVALRRAARAGEDAVTRPGAADWRLSSALRSPKGCRTAARRGPSGHRPPA